jgi:hypothetical protein
MKNGCCCMAKTSIKRRNIIIPCIIVVVLVIASIGAFVLYSQSRIGLVIVSGQAYVSGAFSLPPTTIQKIEFTDTQTGTVTTFNFHFASQGDNRAGDYSVTLKNEHTYSVAISYYFDGDLINSDTTHITTFTVNATAGQTAITKNFI